MPRYWFRQKRFGYGATPNTWQGWLFTIAGAVLTLAVIIAADFMRDDGVRLVLIAVGLPLVLVPTVLISHAKTEGGWVRSSSPKANEMVRWTISSDERREHSERQCSGNDG